MLLLQLLLLLVVILIGSQMKGIGLGVMGMLGLLVFVGVFHLRPAEPPLDVMLIILAIVTTGATMQAAGGLQYLVSLAERIIRSNPARVTFIAPITSFVLCLFAGTSHIVYSLLPIVSEVAAKKRIRPERPLSITVIASHVALTGSPMSAATAALAVILAYPGAALDIMKIGIPSCFIGVLAGAFSVRKMGKELDQDPVFLEKMKDPAFASAIDQETGSVSQPVKPGAKTAVLIFCVAILLVVLCGSFPSLVPRVPAGKAGLQVSADGRLTMGCIIEIITLSAAAIIMLVTRTKATDVVQTSMFTAMASAVVSVFGVVWMSATFIAANEAVIRQALGGMAQAHPWLFTFAVFLMAALIFSQAATTKTMMPLGVALGIAGAHLIAMFPAVNADFVLPGYPTLLAAISFDKTGTTHIGKMVLNHSFMRAGLVTIAVAVAMGFLLGHYLL
ncbi:anaerobic C4-dicarboxylate transporter family protein [Deminuibacter soli]|uniref:Anaerobic C4-dicarboxylate transporter n=1 Tax=Deminuibacter soli TaxID=2291815 RepID=A0A3E1NH30_9BACT|nr:anaerobic C4-dicarboxylate transporter family protein [Deminuibacter soli]RFM27171.1 anaerobic C4-dicarboxylate transporter [Deminuibacter soli]